MWFFFRYQNILLQLNEVKQLEDVVFVKQADVVGMTTSGAAKRRVLLEALQTKISQYHLPNFISLFTFKISFNPQTYPYFRFLYPVGFHH